MSYLTIKAVKKVLAQIAIGYRIPKEDDAFCWKQQKNAVVLESGAFIYDNVLDGPWIEVVGLTEVGSGGDGYTTVAKIKTMEQLNAFLHLSNNDKFLRTGQAKHVPESLKFNLDL